MIKKIKTLLFLSIALLNLNATSFESLAANPNSNTGTITNISDNDYKFNVNNSIRVKGDKNKDKLEETSVSNVIVSIIIFATQIIGTIAVLILIIGGFMMILSQGNDNTISKGKDIIKYAIIGLVITFLSYIIVTFVQSFITEKVGPTPPIEDSSVDPNILPPSDSDNA